MIIDDSSLKIPILRSQIGTQFDCLHGPAWSYRICSTEWSSRVKQNEATEQLQWQCHYDIRNLVHILETIRYLPLSLLDRDEWLRLRSTFMDFVRFESLQLRLNLRLSVWKSSVESFNLKLSATVVSHWIPSDDHRILFINSLRLTRSALIKRLKLDKEEMVCWG